MRAFLRRHRRIALDTSVFIYQLEANPQWAALTDHIFAWIEQPGHVAVTSTITMTELLVHPYRDADERLVNRYFGLLSVYPHLEWISADLVIADEAARIRAMSQLRIPDALQAATALRSHATGFVTNDPVFERIAALDTLVLDNLLTHAG